MADKKHASPSIEVWRSLYEAAVEFRDLNAWDWMSDSDNFGVQDPATGEIGYCTVMGALGEFHALAAYLGTEGLEMLERTISGETTVHDIEIAHQQKCLMASFESRRDLDRADLDVIKELGLSFRGKHQWPRFRSHEPGLFPWYLTCGEATFLTHILEQAKLVCLRVKEDPYARLHPNGKKVSRGGEGVYLVRMSEQKDGALVWKDEWLKPDRSPEPDVERPVEVDELRLTKMRKTVKQTDAIWEADVFHSPAPIQESADERPHYPPMCLLVDQGTGIVYSALLAEADEHRQAFVGELLKAINTSQTRPREIWVKRKAAYDLFRGVAEKLGIGIRLTPFLVQLEAVQRALLNHILQR
ncbi:MAG: hypothetical protein NUW23_14395 [Firmicutes bacterium]|nr:hypothetical protein [Bacillota bacterium]